METVPLTSAIIPALVSRLTFYKQLGDKTFEQLQEADFFFKPSAESNSIAVIIQHFYGNAISRFTNFLTEDGEKPWRQRDAEFEDMSCSREDLLSFWNDGWKVVLDTIASLSEADLSKEITIRSEPLTVMDAILRQLAHYAYHAGQVVYIAKMLKNEQWHSLSIPRKKTIN